MQLALIPAGEFLMGASETEAGYDKDREKQRWVKIGRPFYIGVYEVTQSQYLAVTNVNPSKYKKAEEGATTENFPVEKVTWEDAVEFCKILSEKEGEIYRLPTSAEWEFACRAGTTTPFHFGSSLNGEQANCDGRYPYPVSPRTPPGKFLDPAPSPASGPFLERPCNVGSYPGNAFGLHDMHGNVLEWCSDLYALEGDEIDQELFPDHRVVRGGAWWYGGNGARAAFSSPASPRGDGDWTIGFRVVRELPVSSL